MGAKRNLWSSTPRLSINLSTQQANSAVPPRTNRFPNLWLRRNRFGCEEIDKGHFGKKTLAANRGPGIIHLQKRQASRRLEPQPREKLHRYYLQSIQGGRCREVSALGVQPCIKEKIRMIQIVHGANRRATSFGKIAAQLISVRGLIRPIINSVRRVPKSCLLPQSLLAAA